MTITTATTSTATTTTTTTHFSWWRRVVECVSLLYTRVRTLCVLTSRFPPGYSSLSLSSALVALSPTAAVAAVFVALNRSHHTHVLSGVSD